MSNPHLLNSSTSAGPVINTMIQPSCSWVIKQKERNILFSFLSVESQIEGFSYCSSPLVCNQKITETKRQRGLEVGWSILARSERNLCVWSMALCMSACEPGNFVSCMHKHVYSFYFIFCSCHWGKKRLRFKDYWSENYCLWLYAFQTKPLLYLIITIYLQQATVHCGQNLVFSCASRKKLNHQGRNLDVCIWMHELYPYSPMIKKKKTFRNICILAFNESSFYFFSQHNKNVWRLLINYFLFLTKGIQSVFCKAWDRKLACVVNCTKNLFVTSHLSGNNKNKHPRL